MNKTICDLLDSELKEDNLNQKYIDLGTMTCMLDPQWVLDISKILQKKIDNSELEL